MARLVHRRWRGFEHHVQEWDEVGAGLLKIERCGAGAGVGVDDREVDLLLIRAKVKEELIDLVNHLLDACVGAIDLVDDEHDREGARERLGEDVARLWERALRGINEQEHRINGEKAALHFTTEVGVTWSVHNHHAYALELDRRLLRKDRDPLLALKVPAVHHALYELFVGAEGAVLAQEAVHQRGLPMVNVRDDADGANARLGDEICGGV